MDLPFFVYGTLRPGESNFWRVEQWVRGAEEAEMAGLQLWDLGPYPMAIEGPGRLRGALLTIDGEHYARALEVMDALEQVDPLAPTEPGGLYWRSRRTVILPGCGGPLPEAWVYLGDPSRALQGRRVASGDWLRRSPRP